ncbi:FtsB family cell division protein [Paenibacillus camelliae]|uniref:FtsB family cell division protein n=1 Tax=Paenibacillus camelliae TaxID=512410 RepID=UPI002042444F|nr:septum formation initiator family protein [Paenibacillus camelliae]MCM3635875.1 septum formation initiator family protein [Paenibacillus camelliae]
MVQGKSVQAATKRRLKIWLFLIVLFMGWAVYTVINQMYQKDHLNEQLLSLEANRDVMEQKLQELENKVMLLNDPEYMSQLATKEQGLVREGEQQIFSE